MITSPLRYPGGKAKLFPFFSDLIRQNSLYSATYCEPYAGGAGLAIKLLTSGFVQRIAINDIDASIYAFWSSALFDTDRFCRLIARTPITIDEWHRQRDIWEDGDLGSPLTLGFSAFFLNRTNRSGIIEGAGPIGGFEQNGAWKLDVRLVKDKQIRNLKSLSRFRNQIRVSNIDALKFIDTTLSDQEALTYLDPPYYVKGHKLYKNFYSPDDHAVIAKELKRKRKTRWVVSYDDVPEIRALYNSFAPITYLLNYSAGEKSLGSEVIFASDALDVPAIEGFNIHHRRRSAPKRIKKSKAASVAKRAKPSKRKVR